MKPRFEVSTEGMAELHRGREPWQLAKELIANAWDEASTVCSVKLDSLTSRTARLQVYDDGPGFADIADAWTLMAHTSKRSRSDVRGRFNIGEKEILSIAKEAKIWTAGKVISFPPEGGHTVKAWPKTAKGTTIDVVVPWGPCQVKETIARLKYLLPPKSVRYNINGVDVAYHAPDKVIEATLETVLQAGGPGDQMRLTRRKTTIELHKNGHGDGMLYEMGIPIQEIPAPWKVDVMQKVPLPPNRDVAKASYLQDIYTAIMNETANDIADPSATWVRTAVEDKDAKPEAVKKVLEKRYGEKVVLWSGDSRANDSARRAGYQVVHGQTLSAGEREAFGAVGLVHASDVFKNNPPDDKDTRISLEKWTPGMVAVSDYAKRLAVPLLGHPITTSMYCDIRVAEAASYGGNHLSFNVGRLGKRWFESIGPGVTSLVLHELSHDGAMNHEYDFYKSLEEIAGKAVHLALAHPEVFKVGG